MTSIRLTTAALCAAAVIGCGSTSDPTPTPLTETRALVASKVATAALAVAVGPQGASFFDNFLPCPRRGVIDYHNVNGGRSATFSGCDLGDGVVVDGVAEIRWTRANENPAMTTALSITGNLQARVGAESVVVDPVSVSAIAFAAGNATQGIDLLDRLTVASARVTTAGATVALDTRASPSNVFHPTLTASAIPNATNALDVLEERDVKRIAYHPALAIASILFNETLEVQRGPHTHTTACGTVRVTPDLTTLLTHLDFDWTDCDASLGSFIGGQFSAEWSAFDARTGHLRMILNGRIVVGGGIPRTSFTRLEWDVANLPSAPAATPFSGILVTANGQRPFTFQVIIDD